MTPIAMLFAVATAYARPALLVDTGWLAAHLDDPAVRVVDMRPRGYDEGHIPNAVHLDNSATRDPNNAPAFVPLPRDFERSMERIGVTNGTHVIVYDERGGIYAARLWWLLNYYGHSNVALLDGGWTKWTKEGRATAGAAPQPPAPGRFAARANARWLATAGDVLAAIGKPGVKIVDARTAAEIQGKDLRGIRRGGFIPSSIAVYWEDALDPETKAFKPAAELARLYRDRGILPEHDVIAYCQVGMRASHDLFVLSLLGYDKLRNYLGSWEEWGSREDLPIGQVRTGSTGFEVRTGSTGFEQVRGGSIALVGGRLVDGTGAPPVERSVLVVENGRVAAVGPADTTTVPAGVERIDVTGRTIVPGFINAHGHVGETRGLQSGAELYTEENVRAQLGLYARYGVTTVASLGGDRDAGFTLRDAQRASRPDALRPGSGQALRPSSGQALRPGSGQALRPGSGQALRPGSGQALRPSSGQAARLLVAGPVITAATPEQGRADVDRAAAMKPDLIKIRVDDNLGTAAKMPEPVYRAVIEQAHRHGLRVAAHMFYLDDAKGLLRAGVDFLAHSVRDRAVDDELIALMKARNVCQCPTLMREVSTFVYGDTPEFFTDPFFLREADPAVVEALRDPQRQAGVRESRGAREYRKALDVAAANLKRLAGAGVGIAMGTDTGPPARFQGYFEHMELELMVSKAGLSPMQAIKAATGDAAACLQQRGLGVLQPGAWADFIVLTGNPLEDIRKTRTIESVWIAGRSVSR
jgi:3-mercaptopyruvate sulfurtransferase SseA/imidazolonepropionase-like amidohydrolase